MAAIPTTLPPNRCSPSDRENSQSNKVQGAIARIGKINGLDSGKILERQDKSPRKEPTTSATRFLDVPTAILQRRSIKSFKSDPIPPETLKRLVELTIAAPSSWNLQDWRIILIQEESQRQALAKAAFGQSQILEAPVTFVFAADAYAWKRDLPTIFDLALKTGAWTEKTVEYFSNAIPQFQENLGEKNREYAVKDAIIASNNLVLAAESMGLATCYMNGWVESQVKEIIGAADNPDIAIAVLVPVGYANETRRDPGRLPFSHNIFVDRLGNPYQG